MTENRLIKNNARSHKARFLLIYTLLFAGVCAVVFFFFFLNKKSFIETGDAFNQHYKALLYYSRYLRTVIKNIFTFSRPIIPQWDFSIGLGSDIGTTLHYYAIGDVLNVLSVFVPERLIYVFYSLMLIVRLYLSGLFFSAYCFEMKQKSSFAVLAGALTYAFCGYSLCVSTFHPFFINPMMYLPLLFIGIERIIAKKSPLFFAAAVCFAAASSFYFFYMLVIAAVIYVAARLTALYGKDLKRAVRPFLATALGSVCGLMMSAAVFLPVVTAFLSDGRAQYSMDYRNLYPLDYYLRMPASFITPSPHSFYRYWSYSAVALFGVIVLFLKRKRNVTLKILLALSAVMFMFPIFGRIFNGMSYICNRWSFVFSFLVAFILTVCMPYFLSLTKKELLLTGTALTAYLAVCFLIKNALIKYLLLSAVLCIAVMLALVLVNTLKLFKKDKLKTLAKAGLLLLTVCGIFVNSLYYCGQWMMPRYKDVSSLPGIYSKADLEVKKQAAEDKSKEFFRYAGRGLDYNGAMLSGTHGTQYYWSLSNNNVSLFRTELNLRENVVYMYKGFDDRTFLNALLSVKYYRLKKNDSKARSFGFEKTKSPTVYRNEYMLPFGFTYSSFISREDFDKLSSLQKQEAMLQGAVISEELPGLSKTEPVFTSKDVSFAVKTSDGVKYDGKSFTVYEEGGTAALNFRDIKNAEVYLSFENLEYTSPKNRPLEGESASFNSANPSYADITVTAIAGGEKDVLKSFKCCTPSYEWYFGRHNFDVCLGYNEKAVEKLEISFERPGTYTFDALTVTEQPMEKYPAQIERLKKDVLTDVKFGTNEVSGKISLDRPKLLCLSVPESRGWTAYVDGERAEIINTGLMFSGIMLTEGEHSVKMVYRTPFLRAGLGISASGVLIFALYAVIGRRREKIK